jgi:xanthine phosphoribosyltransferase
MIIGWILTYSHAPLSPSPFVSVDVESGGISKNHLKRINDNFREAAMQALKERILREGKNLGNGILKVDGFINHQVDPRLMDACGKELALRFQDVRATKVLTAEISGIAPAVTTAIHLNLPVVYARKNKPITMPDQVFLTLTPSHTKGREVELIISPEYLAGGERVLIIDDFLATGATILGLVRLAQTAGAVIVGIGALIEKTFEGGRQALAYLEVPVVSLAAIRAMEGDEIIFADEPLD